ncbi:hypothetical protein IAU60_004818 [Kwoniella sp. DSM 27419]
MDDHLDHSDQHDPAGSAPLNLAAASSLASAADLNAFAIDPALAGPSEFFPDASSIHHTDDHEASGQAAQHIKHQSGSDHDARRHENGGLDSEPSHDDFAAVIKASLAHAQAAASASTSEPAAGVQSSVGTSANHETSSLVESIYRDRLGEEQNPIRNPTLNVAPFNRPNRDDNTPHPQYHLFNNRGDFNRWLDAECSWCHYVQRRTTTPDKRSAERLQARIRAHNRQMAALDPAARAAAAPLKTRRRNRVSPVLEKVTFTCHHAGSYESKHSTTLPKEKLRLNTKKSVKCACASRIVLSEMQDGQCKVVYHWRHEGHDPFSDEDVQGGRLPKIIDVWLNKQIEAGKNLDDIRKVLSVSEEDKESYLTRVANDPTLIDPDMPPPLALSLKVKYPDIYNRYRKLRGPVKENKVLKGSLKRTASGQVKAGSRRRGGGIAGEDDSLGVSSATPGEDQKLWQQQQQQQGIPGTLDDHSQSHSHGEVIVDSSMEGDLAGSDHAFGIGTLASHEGLARALLELPSGNLRDEDGNEMSLEEAMRRMAEGVAGATGSGEVGVSVEDELGMGLLSGSQ